MLAFAWQTYAHAATTLPLTDSLIGHWCLDYDDDANAEGPTYTYKRGVWDCKGNLAITHSGYTFYGRHEYTCSFTRVTPLAGQYYIARAECESDRNDSKEVETVKFQIVGDALKYTDTTSGCSVVGHDMPDGFLNLRKGPSVRYDVKARLITGDVLASINGDRRGKWVRVKALRVGVTGWLDEKYIDASNKDCSRDAVAEGQ